MTVEQDRVLAEEPPDPPQRLRVTGAPPRMSARAVISFVGLQISWFACVLGAASGYAWVGPVVVLVALSMHVRRQPAKPRELHILGTSAVVGFLVDTALIRFGVVRIHGTMLSPPWLVALWPNFISTTAENGLLRSLPRRPLLAGLLGAVGGPLAYDSAARLGAIELGSHRVGALAIIGIVWAIIVPTLVSLRARQRAHFLSGLEPTCPTSPPARSPASSRHRATTRPASP